MLSMQKTTLAVIACGFFSGAAAQRVSQFDSIPGTASEPNVQVDLGPATLAFVAEAARQSDPGVADMIAGLRGISVRVYESVSDAPAVQSFVDRTVQSLEQGGWERVVFVQDGDDKVRVHALVENNQMVGMTFMVLDSSDAVFINIDGQIDPAQLGRVAAAMGLGDMLGAFFGAVQSAPLSAPRGPSSAPQGTSNAPPSNGTQGQSPQIPGAAPRSPGQ